MFAKIFKRVSIKTFIVSFFLCFIFIVFTAYCFFLGKLTQESVIRTFGLSFLLVMSTFLVSLSENKNLNRRFGAIHLLSFPLALLLFNWEGVFDFKKSFILFGLLFSLNIFSSDLKNKQPSGQIFSLGILITGISFYNYYLAFFYTVPLLFFLESQYRKRMNGILLLASIFLTLQFLMAVSYLTTDNFFYESTPIVFKNSFNGLSHNVSETPWIITIIISLIISIFYRPKEYKFSVEKNDAHRTFQFMTVWLVISILFRYFNLHIGKGEWLLSFIPSAFFLGLGIEFIKKDKLKDVLIIIIIITAVLFKLHLNSLFSF